MNKKEYIERLYEFTNRKNTTIYQYYKKLAILCRKHKQFELIGFEAENPFLTQEDYSKLLSSSDELMPEFFARAMVKVIQLNDMIIEEEERKAREAANKEVNTTMPTQENKDTGISYNVIKNLIESEYEKAAKRDETPKAMASMPKKETSLAVIPPKCTSLVPVSKKKDARKTLLSREEIKKIIENGLYKDDKKQEEIPQEIISQYLESKKPRQPIAALEAPKEKREESKPTKEDRKSSILGRILNRPKSNGKVEEVLNKLTNGARAREEQKPELPREIIEQYARRAEPLALPPHIELSKEDIRDSINQAIDNIQSTEAEENKGLVPVTASQDEKPKRKGLFGLTSINLGLIEKLKGLALIRESKTGKADLYYRDPKTNALKGKTSVDGIKADSGYYVNYQEYIYKMLAHTMSKHPNATDLRFVNAEGEERTISETVEEVFRTLRDAGSIRFGNEYASANISSYSDLKKIKPGYGLFANEKLKKGIYVRKDILREEFRKYKIRFTLKKEEIKVYKKTK